MSRTASTASRRGLLTAVGALALPALPAKVASPNPDANLVAMRDELSALRWQWTHMSREGGTLLIGSPREEELHTAMVAMVPTLHALQDRIAEVPAKTSLGLQAKAEALRLKLAGDADATEPMDPDNGLAWSLALDVLRLIGGVA